MFHNVRSIEEFLYVVSEYLNAPPFAIILSGSKWEQLGGLVWLYRVAELFSYKCQIVSHFTDGVSLK